MDNQAKNKPLHLPRKSTRLSKSSIGTKPSAMHSAYEAQLPGILEISQTPTTESITSGQSSQEQTTTPAKKKHQIFKIFHWHEADRQALSLRSPTTRNFGNLPKESPVPEKG